MRRFIEAVATIFIGVLLIIGFLGIVAKSFDNKFKDLNNRPKNENLK